VRPKRHWPRRVLVLVNFLVLACLVAVGAGYEYVNNTINSITTAPSPHETPTSQLASGAQGGSDGLQPENILLIGNETRQGLTPAEEKKYGSSVIYSGTLADIMMVLHLDPATRTASILSIPRDLFSPMPAGSLVGPYQKMDAALNDGADGPDNLVNAIQEDLGIPINHFIELNFNGFINSIDALGGIKVYFPDPVWDAESLLWVPVRGCRELNGVQALALVRARHLQYDPPGDHQPRYDWPFDPESDLARIVRTHTFMRIVAETAEREGKTNPLTAVSFISAVTKQMTVDASLRSQLLALVEHYRNINPADVPETTLATTQVNDYFYGGADIGDVLFPVQPENDEVIEKWDPQALPKPVRPASVSVVSITGSSSSAAAAGQALASDGLDVTSETAGEVPASTTETLVTYHPGPHQVARALYVMKYLAGSVMMQPSTAVPLGTVQVDLGSAVNVTAKPAPGTTTAPATSTSGAQTSTSAASAVKSPVATTTSVPTPGGESPSQSRDLVQPWDPRACAGY